MSVRGTRKARIEARIKERASEVILFELKDPRMALVTVTRCEISRDVRFARIWWSALGSDGDVTATAHALDGARKHVQREIGKVLRTRNTPRIEFVFDESVEGAIRVSHIIDAARAEDDETARERGDDADDEADDGDMEDDDEK